MSPQQFVLPHSAYTGAADRDMALVRDRIEPLGLQVDAAAALAVAHELARELHELNSLRTGLARTAARLGALLGASGHAVLRVHDWNGSTALVRPWPHTASGSEEIIDLTQLVPTRSDERPLGMALATLRPMAADVAPAAPGPGGNHGSIGAAWRPPQVQRVLALPVIAGDEPVAVLELYEPGDSTPAVRQLLDLAALQLSQVAQRERSHADAATTAEHANRLALAASRIAGGVVITDADGTVEWLNPAFTEVTGLLATDILGQPFWAAMAQSVAKEGFANELRTLFAQGHGFRHEYIARHRGREADYWGEIDVLVIGDERGQRAQYVCLCNDITQRRQRELELSEGRDMLTALTENVPISLVVVDARNFSVVSINRHAEVEFGASRAEAAGRSLDEALGAGMRRLMEQRLREALARRGSVEHDFVMPTVEGERIISARHVAVRDPHGAPRLLICQLRDITARRRTELDLMESELRYKELIESMEEGVFVTTPQRDTFQYFNERLLDLWGIGPDEFRADPRCHRARIHPEDLPLLDEPRERELRFEPTDDTYRVLHPQLGMRWMRQRTRTRALPDGEVRVYGLLSDVTDERERELQLQGARDVAEAASQAKSQFMANMSHEIRTPMNGILGMTELLLGTELSDRQRRFAQAVYRSGESLLEIINDILDFAKIEAGRLELAPSDFTLRAVVEDTLELLAPRAHEKGLELSFREGAGLPAVMHADPLRLRQVLTNLVANAIKFTERGEVTVDLNWVPPAEDHRSPLLEFVVRDTGIGIAAHVLPQLFSAFTQAHNGMSRRYGGTGLGLAISKQLVELMGGAISVRSAPGVGSEFRFTIAVAPAQVAQAPSAESLEMPALRVLVVEDNPTNRVVLENMLTAWGMSVILATDGQHALELLQGLPAEGPGFDLALVDWRMPHMDGIRMAQALREQNLLRGMKLILLSSVSAPDEQRVAQDAGFVRFIHKPVRKAELRQAILGVAAPRQPEADAATLPHLDRHILVVEDNPVNQEVMGQMLRRLGCRVHVAGSALEGLRALTEHRFDMVLMDIQMPGMDGVEALTWFRRGPRGRFAFVTPPGIPVVAVTANALEGDEERFLRQGFDDYLSKPFRQNQLLALLNRRLRGPGGGDAAAQPAGPASTAATPAAGPVVADGLAAQALHAASSAPGPAAATPFPAPPPHKEPAMNPPSPPSAAPQPPADGGGADTGAAILDAQALQRLRDLDPTGQNQLMERVFKAFDTSVGRLLPQLEEAAQTADLQGVRHVTHTLKSSSASIGALKLSKLCADTEAQVRAGGPITDLPERVQTLRGEILRVQRRLQDLMSESTP
jgi:PAS domain S-box-containing protein